ncbi:TetR/AcrR family transcriptional regulator [Mycobacterium sp. M26]|uniref:TetR/AcrR family transcriptional regulator n=1 Tax=Mycobacterium sp. M26 TaxID=1762962 RepID=UPI00073F217B|nr:TetR/AcrR family transcriptional regulator [Mycobacterium sp. M26]
MAQARAEVTRQSVVDAAISLFSKKGYGETTLAEVQQLAGVTKGAFYYHFDSKDALAAAVIAEFHDKIRTAFRQAIDPPAQPTMENIIRGTFAVAELMQNDESVQVGNELSQALGQVSDAGRKIFAQTTVAFVGEVAKAFAGSDLRSDVDPADVGECIWVGVIGCQFLAAALGDDLVDRLARAWRVLLRAIVPAESLPYFDEVLRRAAAERDC